MISWSVDLHVFFDGGPHVQTSAQRNFSTCGAKWRYNRTPFWLKLFWHRFLHSVRKLNFLHGSLSVLEGCSSHDVGHPTPLCQKFFQARWSKSLVQTGSIRHHTSGYAAL